MPIGARVKRGMRRIGHTTALAKIGPKFAPYADRFVHRLSRGRWTMSQLLVPSLVLTTTGRKTGQPRDVPLATVPEPDGTFLVVGSNFGQQHHPAWSGNLLADDHATVSYKRRQIPVTARLLDEDEKAAVWPKLVDMWPAYDTYVERSRRDLRVFRLEPRSAGH